VLWSAITWHYSPFFVGFGGIGAGAFIMVTPAVSPAGFTGLATTIFFIWRSRAMAVGEAARQAAGPLEHHRPDGVLFP